MKKKIFLPTIKKVDLPEDVTSEVKLLAEKRFQNMEQEQILNIIF